VWLFKNQFSQERIASIIGATKIGEQVATLAVTINDKSCEEILSP
jgi:hypothetical protein